MKAKTQPNDSTSIEGSDSCCPNKSTIGIKKKGGENESNVQEIRNTIERNIPVPVDGRESVCAYVCVREWDREERRECEEMEIWGERGEC